MGRFHNGVHYSTQSQLGPNERFGIEDDMSFQEMAKNIEKNKNKQNCEEETPCNKEYNIYELLKELQEKKQTIYNLSKENEQLLNEKRDLIERNKNILKLKSESSKNKSDSNENINIDVIGGKNGKYTEGVYIESFEGKYGQILKFSINLQKFAHNNRVTPKGYVYFEVKKSQSGKYYATPQKYFKNN